MRKLWIFTGAALAVALSLAPAANAADHVDGPAASADPAADITDVFAWMSPDAARVNLVMNVARNAGSGSRFSDQVQYVFHTSSQASYGAASRTDLDIICQFDAAQRVECWVGTQDYLTGDASSSSGILSNSGRTRAFAGLRNDPFFFNLIGFKETALLVQGAASSLKFDPAGCPDLNAATSAALVGQLMKGKGGAAAADDFGQLNVLALVLSVDKSLLTTGGLVLGVAGSTNRR